MKWAATVAVAIVGLVVAYWIAYPTTSYRFKITLSVDSPDGLRSGSSVMEVRTRRYPAWTTLGNNSEQSSLTGEAVFVDLGQTSNGKPRNVIALLALGPSGENVDFYLLPDSAFKPLWQQKVSSPDFRGSSWELPKLPVGTTAQLTGNLVPTLLSFADLSDPSSAREMGPDDFPQVLGNGFRLRDAKIEIVSADEPITRGIERKLPWWDKPLPWVKSIGSGVYVDTRRAGHRWTREQLKRGT